MNLRRGWLTALWLLLAFAGRAETVDEARTQFAQARRPLPTHGLYEDFRGFVYARSGAVNPDTQKQLLAAARKADIRVVLAADKNLSNAAAWHDLHEGVLFMRGAVTNHEFSFPDFAADGKPLPDSGLLFAPDESVDAAANVFLRGINDRFQPNGPSNWVTHILAREFTEPQVRDALSAGHFYVADDWLCDPTGFMFGVVNNQGVFTMGEEAAIISKTRIMAITPTPAKLRLVQKGVVLKETYGTNLIFEAKEAGAYRLEAWLTVAGQDQLWIASTPVNLRAAGLRELSMLLPLASMSPDVKLTKGISYGPDATDNSDKHKLDVYSGRGLTNAPVLFFIHGGAWKTGDRSYYLPLGNRYAREGCVTVLPSYRLAPKYPHPAQVEDVATAFAWTVRHVAEYGGDTNRIYVGGHSAGGHLAALLALDDHYLAAHQLSPKLIRGVLAFSGVYNLNMDALESVFGTDPQTRAAAAPLSYVKASAPPFLVSYCEWDYFSLPGQAREFHTALQKAGTRSELLYVPRQDHLSEMINVGSKDDPTVAAALKFMK